MEHDCPPAVAVMSPRAATTSALGFGGVVFRLGASPIARRTREHQAQLLLMLRSGHNTCDRGQHGTKSLPIHGGPLVGGVSRLQQWRKVGL